MNRVMLRLCVVFAAALMASPAPAGELVLKRVMLSTGGVAYLEHEAEVSGDADLTLDVPLDQVDDVLKSIVVYDSKGGVGSASLPGREPVAQVFNDLPFGEDALQSPAALLNALQGAEIRVAPSGITGKLLKVVSENERFGDTTTTHNRVSLLTATGLQQFVLEDAGSVAFTDASLQAKVDKALGAIAAHRAKDRRQIVLSTHGDGRRTVRVGYVVGAPLWKATYRVTLPQQGDKAKLQGWAVLENMSGQDWKDVELTLLSGNPVSFRQAIYEAYYVQRPEVPVEVAGRILPKADTGNVMIAQTAAAAPSPYPGLPEIGVTARRREENIQNVPITINALSAAAPYNPKPSAPPPPPLAALVGTADAVEDMTQISFHVPIPVTIASGRSAFVPLIDRDVPAERVALYQQEVRADHPLASARLTNDGPNGLPPGVVTFYEEAAGGAEFIGDARLAGLPAGESRLLSFALDGKIKITRDEHTVETLSRATIAQGVMNLADVDRQIIELHVVAPAREARRLIVEQAKYAGWHLVDPVEDAVDQTASAYRPVINLSAGESKTLTLTLERQGALEIKVADCDANRIAQIDASSEIDPAVKQAFVQLAQLRRVVADKRFAHEEIAQDMTAVTEDQPRIRENLAKIDKGSALYRRYTDKLADQETKLEALQTANAKAEDELRAATAAVDAYIAKLNF